MSDQVKNLSPEQEEAPLQTSETELTNVIIWALRKLTAIEDRFYSAGIFRLIDNWLTNQETELVELLKTHPKHVKRLLVLRQQRQSSANKSGQRYIQNEEPGE